MIFDDYVQLGCLSDHIHRREPNTCLSYGFAKGGSTAKRFVACIWMCLSIFECSLQTLSGLCTDIKLEKY